MELFEIGVFAIIDGFVERERLLSSLSMRFFFFFLSLFFDDSFDNLIRDSMITVKVILCSIVIAINCARNINLLLETAESFFFFLIIYFEE